MEGHPEVGGKRGRKKNLNAEKIMYESVVVITFQSVFYLEMHQNDIFFYF